MEWESFDIALEKKCDAWSYGSVLLEMLTGKAPWSELSEAELGDKAKRGAPPPLPDELAGDGHAELLAKTREFLALDPSARPHFDKKLGADFDLMLLIAAVKAEPAKADFTSTVTESIQKMKMKKLIEHEMQKDADAYKRAWEACERGVTPYVVANLKADCADLQEYFTPPKKEDLRQPVPVKTAKELVAMASATNETFHATLRPLVEAAGLPIARTFEPLRPLFDDHAGCPTPREPRPGQQPHEGPTHFLDCTHPIPGTRSARLALCRIFTTACLRREPWAALLACGNQEGGT